MRRRWITGSLCIALLLGPWVGARADDGPLPEPCKPHPTHVVNPGCVSALTELANGVVDEALSHDTTYPDLVPNVTDVSIFHEFRWDPATETFTEGPPRFHFDTYAQNLGTVPLDLAADDPTNTAGSTVSQCVSWKPPYVCRERAQVGGFEWHDEHTHYHYLDFAYYQLRTLTADGSPDWSASGLVGTSDKVSFCLLDSQQVSPDAVPVPTYLTCNPLHQGISPGWSDIYNSGLPGQSMSLAGLPEGRYALVVALNPAGHVRETDSTNNRVVVIVEVSNFDDFIPQATIVSRSWE